MVEKTWSKGCVHNVSGRRKQVQTTGRGERSSDAVELARFEKRLLTENVGNFGFRDWEERRKLCACERPVWRHGWSWTWWSLALKLWTLAEKKEDVNSRAVGVWKVGAGRRGALILSRPFLAEMTSFAEKDSTVRMYYSLFGICGINQFIML